MFLIFILLCTTVTAQEFQFYLHDAWYNESSLNYKLMEIPDTYIAPCSKPGYCYCAQDKKWFPETYYRDCDAWLSNRPILVKHTVACHNNYFDSYISARLNCDFSSSRDTRSCKVIFTSELSINFIMFLACVVVVICSLLLQLFFIVKYPWPSPVLHKEKLFLFLYHHYYLIRGWINGIYLVITFIIISYSISDSPCESYDYNESVIASYLFLIVMIVESAMFLAISLPSVYKKRKHDAEKHETNMIIFTQRCKIRRRSKSV